MTAQRLSRGGRIDRTKPLRFTWDGAALTGFEGDSLAAALLAANVRVVGRSFKYHRPRGIYGAWTEEPNAIADVRVGDTQEPDARATTIALREGLAACSVNAQPNAARDRYRAIDLAHAFIPAGFYYKTFFPNWQRYEPRIREMAGLGRAGTAPDTRHFEARSAACDVLVVGAGPAGLAAARAAASAGLSVILADDRFAPGGSLLWQDAVIEDRPGAVWAADTAVALAAEGVRVMPGTTVFGAYDHGAFGLLERRAQAAPGWAEDRLWQVRARQAVLAPGAIERPLVFPDNDRPGVMSADAVLQYLRLYGVQAGETVVIATNNDSAYAVARALCVVGATVTVADTRPEAPPVAHVLREAGVRIVPGSTVLGTIGRDGVTQVDLGPPEATSRRAARLRLGADLLAVSGGWSPAVHLHSQSGGKLRWDEARAAGGVCARASAITTSAPARRSATATA